MNSLNYCPLKHLLAYFFALSFGVFIAWHIFSVEEPLIQYFVTFTPMIGGLLTMQAYSLHCKQKDKIEDGWGYLIGVVVVICCAAINVGL